MRKLAGVSLVEVLIALCVLGIAVPVLLGALGDAFVAELKIQENAYVMSSAEWWFARLTFPVHMAEIDAAPRTDENGKASFEWETENLDNGAIRVTLRVYGSLSEEPFTTSRIF